MSPQWDIAAYDRFGRLTLIVEVKRLFNKSPQWVARLRRDYAAHQLLPSVPFFMVAMPDVFYLWKDVKSNGATVLPTFAVPAAPILQPFLKDTTYRAENISSDGLELIVAAWLGSVMYAVPEEFGAEQSWVVDSGLYAALYGGTLNQAVAA